MYEIILRSASVFPNWAQATTTTTFTLGSVKESIRLYGTYLHGVFERPAFRRYFISSLRKSNRTESSKPSKDYKESEDYNLDKLADGFEKHMDMEAFDRILEGLR